MRTLRLKQTQDRLRSRLSRAPAALRLDMHFGRSHGCPHCAALSFCAVLTTGLPAFAGSAYLRHVSTEATTTRSSIVTRSMPTNEIRTQASITMLLSNTRSSTSIKLELPDTRSTAIGGLLRHTRSACSLKVPPGKNSEAHCVLTSRETSHGISAVTRKISNRDKHRSIYVSHTNH